MQRFRGHKGAPRPAPAQRIIDYTQDSCGSSLPPVSGTTATTEQIEL